MKTSDIKGIIPPVITPMNNDDEQTVNHEALRQQVERLLAGGVHGMFLWAPTARLTPSPLRRRKRSWLPSSTRSRVASPFTQAPAASPPPRPSA